MGTHHSLLRCSVIIFLITTLSACSMLDKVDEITDKIADTATSTTAVLEDAIENLDRNSADWQNVLQGTVGQLSETASDTASQVDGILNRTVAATGTEFRCSADFLGQRVKEQLKNILAKLKGQDPQPLRPHICTTVPDNVATDKIPDPLTHISFSGYNFDISSELKAYVERTDGSKRNITSKLNMPTHYSMTLPFGTTGAVLGSRDQRILVTWNDQPLVSVGITQPGLPECEEKEISFTPSNITFIPNRHTDGDREFAGHGPRVTGSVKLIEDVSAGTARKVKMRVQMKARETKKDWTTVEGQKDYDVFSFPSGYKIVQRLTPSTTISSFDYTDSNHRDDVINPGQGPARQLIITGDTKGKDVGKVKAVVHFNQVRYKIRQVSNCAAPGSTPALLIKPIKMRMLAP